MGSFGGLTNKNVNTFNTVTNQQQAIQGGGNFAVSGGLNTYGGSITFESLDPGAIDAMERVATEAILASGRYVEFASESNIRGLEANSNVAAMAIGTGMTPEQITASQGGETAVATDNTNKILLGIAVLGGLFLIAKKFL